VEEQPITLLDRQINEIPEILAQAALSWLSFCLSKAITFE